jgi:Carboxypeptidase regulatory-like domain
MIKNSARPRFFLALLVCLAAFCFSTASAWAQSATTGALTGTVTDPTNAVVAGASVVASSKATGQERTTTTDASGVYKFSLLSPGDYSVKFSATGFKTETVDPVKINVTETAMLNRKLEVGSQTTTLTVESTVQTIQAENATVGTLVGSETVTTLPLNSRNYTQIIDLSPGVVANEQKIETMQTIAARPLANLGVVYFGEGNYAQAQAMFERFLAITQSTLLPNSPRIAQTLDDPAATYEKEGPLRWCSVCDSKLL